MLRPALLAFLSAASLSACCEQAPLAVVQPDPLLHENDRSYLDGYAPLDEDGLVNVVVEIPAGTTGKWEVTKPEGELRWEVRNGAPRVVQYLGYPANYGMIPRTLLPKELGGDGDPLDVVILGDAVPRGSVVKTRVIGMMRMLDDGEQDDKLVAVREGTPFYQAHTMATLQEKFGGTTTILQQWFTNYKGNGKIQILGFVEADEAMAVLNQSIDAYLDRKKFED